MSIEDTRVAKLTALARLEEGELSGVRDKFEAKPLDVILGRLVLIAAIMLDRGLVSKLADVKGVGLDNAVKLSTIFKAKLVLITGGKSAVTLVGSIWLPVAMTLGCRLMVE